MPQTPNAYNDKMTTPVCHFQFEMMSAIAEIYDCGVFENQESNLSVFHYVPWVVSLVCGR